MAKKYLSQAKKQLGKKEEFYIALEKALHNYLKGRLNIETTDLSKEKIKELLLSRNVEQSVILDFETLLKHCELARYTPMTQVAMEQDYNNAATTISIIDKQLK